MGYVKYFILKRKLYVDNPNTKSAVKRINLGEYYLRTLHFDNELDESNFLENYEYIEKFDNIDSAVDRLSKLNELHIDYIYTCLNNPTEE